MSADQAEPPAALRTFADGAVRQLRDDTARIGRALRALPSSDLRTSPALFSAINAAYRRALANAKQVEALDLSYEHRSIALTVFTMQASGLEAYDRSLRATTRAGRRRLDERARLFLEASGAAFLQLDRLLGCPYGCEERP